MNINKHMNRLTIVDKQYRLRQLSAKTQKTNQQFSRKIGRLKIVTSEHKKAA